MKPPRDVQLEEPKLRLKFATRKTVKANGGTALAAEIVGTRQQRISDCQLANVPEFLRLDEALDLEANAEGTADFPAITRAMARNHGFELMPLPREAPAGDFHRALAEVQREASEATATVLDALPNGITADEIRDLRIIDEIDEALAAWARLRGLCVSELDRGT